jgi:enoyl-CoA hydratase
LIHVEREDAVALVTIDRPEAMNALDVATLTELRDRLRELAGDESARAVIVTGAGEKAFVAGADIKYMSGLDVDQAKEWGALGHEAGRLLETMPKPTIAAVNGFALGGGCELAMACTLRIAADTARIGQPEINLGIIPGYAGALRLARLVGKGIAFDLLLTGRQIKADEALAIGLVNRVVPAAELMTTAKMLAAELAAKAPIAVQYILEDVNRGLETSFDKAQVHEATLFGLVASTADMREGTRAFLEKRKPQFKGE